MTVPLMMKINAPFHVRNLPPKFWNPNGYSPLKVSSHLKASYFFTLYTVYVKNKKKPRNLNSAVTNP